MEYTVPRVYPRAELLEMARDFSTSINRDYMYFPQSEYSALLIVGDWDFTDYTYENATVYTLGYHPGGGASDPRYLSFSILSRNDSGSVSNPYSVATYSSASYALQLTDKGGVRIETVSAFAVILFTMFFIIRDIFGNVSRH